MTESRQTRHGSLRTEVYRQLLDRILQGQYPDGSALTEASVCHDLGVSRTPVREAFSQLEQDGLVVASPNRSVVVRGFSEQDILDLYDVRSRIETLAAARAARTMSAEQRSQLQAIYDEAQAVTGNHPDDLALLQKLDSDFHDMIVAGSGSKILRNLLHSIGQQTRQARLVSLSRPGRCHNQIQEHKAILQAILEQNSEKADEQMHSHIAMAAESYLAVGKKRRPQ